MSTDAEVTARPANAEPLELSALFDALFCSFPRADQRRWAEAYVRGLIQVPGRKSIRRIADQIVGYRADQSLQQFLNQSPWSVGPIRRSLARHLLAALHPKAWVVEEIAFPKRGTSSVGVTRQYVASLGAAVNCQVGIAVVLAANAGGCPVNWRLTIPESWDRDAERRRQAHVPEHERHQPWWRYVLAALDETIDTWGLPPSPVLVDARHDPRPEPLLRGLEQRGLRYAVRVCGGAPTRQDGCTDSAQGIPARSSRYPTATDLAARMPTRSRVTLTWWDAERGRPGRSQFVLAPVSGESDVHSGVRGHPWLPSRHVVAEWSAGQAMPGAVWITNLNAPRLSELVELLRLRGQASRVLRRLADESGLRHFEGRSFRGWHHHVTLVSVAHAYRVLREVGFANRRARCPRGADGRRLTGHFRGYPDGTGGRHGAAGSCARATAARGAARVPV